MKKKIVAVLMTAAMAASVVACGNDTTTTTTTTDTTTDTTTTTTTTTTTDSDGETTDTVINAGSDDAIANLIAATTGTVDLTLWCSETEQYQTVMATLVDEFKAAYPDVDFNITIGSQSESTCKDEVLKDVEAAADVFVFADDQLQGLVEAGALQPVTTTYTYDPIEADGAGAVNAASINNVLYAYPLTATNGYFLYYNKNYLSDEDVSSWENLVAACEREGKKVAMEFSGGWYLYSFFYGAGLQCDNLDDANVNVCNWNNETGLAVAQSIQSICSSDAVINLGDADTCTQATDGDVIAAVNGTWNSQVFADAYGDGYAATKLPTFNVNGEAVQQGSFAGYKLVGVNAYSDNVGWAMLFAEFITNENSQLEIGNATSEGPANKVAAPQIATPAIAALASQSSFATLQRVSGNYWDPAATLGKALYDGGLDDAGLQQALDDAVSGICAQ